MYLKRFHIGRYDICMLALVVIATAARLVLIYFNWPTTNSDEGTMGIMALHIAYRGMHPSFYYGQNYMGSLEGYMAAPLYYLFGVSLFSLRLSLIPFYSFFLICMYYLVRLLYTERFALAFVLLLCFGSSDIIARELKAIGGYPEMLFFSALISLMVAWFALTAYDFQQDVIHQKAGSWTRRRRILAYGFLGLTVGLALWIDFLILPFVFTGALLLFFFARKELFSRAGLVLLIGIIIGCFPLIVYNVTAPLGRNSINVLLDIHHSGVPELAAMPMPWLRQLIGTFMIAFPTATGANPICITEVIPPFGPIGPSTIHCVLFQGVWTVALLILGLTAAIPLITLAWQQWRRHTPISEWSFEERQSIIRNYARLMLLLSAAMTIFLYLVSANPGLYASPTARYLTCVLTALPAALWPLWHGLRLPKLALPDREQILSIFKAALLTILLVVFIMGTISAFSQVATIAQPDYNRKEDLTQRLQHLGVTRVYSEYWTCNWLIFLSHEQVICSVLGGDLKPGFNRYAPYGTIVNRAAHPAYLFPLNNPTGVQQIATFEHTWLRQNAIHYQKYVFDQYVLYMPETS